MPVTELHAPVPGLPRQAALVRGAQLRAGLPFANLDSLEDRELVAAQYRISSWQTSLRSGAPPSDWRIWLDQLRQVDFDLNGGTAGYLDEELYGSALGYMRRHRAPDTAYRVLSFRRSLAAWDFQQASQAADALLPTVVRLEGWIPAQELYDGGVIAKLLTGETESARRLGDELADYVTRSPGNLKSRMLASYLESAGRSD